MTGLPTFAGHTNGVWVGDIKMFRSLEQRDLMQFVDYQKDRVRRSRITDAGRAALAELTSQTVDAATS
jgi:DNA-binding MarR family transcriptional regulator